MSKTIDNILKNIWVDGRDDLIDGSAQPFDQSIKKYRQQILQWVADEVVGKGTVSDTGELDPFRAEMVQNKETIERTLRFEQRQILRDNGWKEGRHENTTGHNQ